jgi:hypothetical protein
MTICDAFYKWSGRRSDTILLDQRLNIKQKSRIHSPRNTHNLYYANISWRIDNLKYVSGAALTYEAGVEWLKSVQAVAHFFVRRGFYQP